MTGTSSTTKDWTGDDQTPGLTLRQTLPVDAAGAIDAGEHGPAEVWRAIAMADGFQDALVDAVRDATAGVPYYDRVPTLLEAGVTAIDGGYARLLAGLERGPETDAYDRALSLTAQFGQGEVTPLGRIALDELADGPLAVLEAAGVTPTIAVRIGEGFRDRRREQRERTLSLLATVGQVCEVAIITTGLTARWLAREHREQLPRSFSEACTAGRDPTPVGERVETARDRFDPDDQAVRILRRLADEPGETLPYDALADALEVSRSRVSQLLGDLEDADLVEKYGPRSGQRIDLLPAGQAFLETIDEEIGRQQRLDALFSETGQSLNSAVLAHTDTKAPPDAPGDQPPGVAAGVPYRTRYLDRSDHAATSAIASDGEIVAAEVPLPDVDAEDRHTRFVSYDEDQKEAVIAVRATTPLQYMASVALGLASPRLFDKALPPERLDAIDDPPAILRDARCIGALSEEALEDPTVLRDAIVEWGEDLADMTRSLHREEYDDRDQFRGEILRTAHGLAGTVVHLLDVAGIDVVRELHVPTLADEDLAALAKTVSVATAIQSRYGAFTAYRQLFETRDAKRRTSLSPEVDASDPIGTYIGSLVLRGPSARRFGQHVAGHLRSPAPIHEDAPEFVVRIPVGTVGRDAYTAAVNRMLERKRIKATPEAVTMFQALAGDVHAVTEAIRWLGTEDSPRRIRLDEVRVALATLEPDVLLPDAPPSVSKAVAALLTSSRPLSQTTLAEAADVSTRSLRRHLEALVALDVVRATDEGYRLALPFSEDERGETIVPAAVTDDLAARQDLAFDVALALVDDVDRFGDPADPVGGAFLSSSPNFTALRTHLPAINPYLRVAKTLCNGPDPSPSVVTFGADLEQTSLEATVGAGGAD